MTGLRLGTAIAVVLGLLAVAVWAFWPSGDGDDLAAPTSTTAPTTTAGTSTTSTTPSTSSTTSTTLPDTTTTTSADQRVAEVELILEELWFGWFDAIYRKDEEALWQVVATRKAHADGVAAMTRTDLFTEAPDREAVDVLVSDVLLDRADCLVVFHEVDVSGFRGPNAVAMTVSVLWPDRSTWRFATQWQNPNDLWLSDCDDLEREPTP